MTIAPDAVPLDGDVTSASFDRYLAAAASWGGRVGPLLAALRAVPPGDLLPLPGAGATAERFRLLARVAEADVTAARALEPHADAVAILAEAGQPQPQRGTTWGVFAAEAPDATLDAIADADGWVLHGRKAWCSLAGELSHALVTATTLDGERRMFAVDLGARGVTAEPAHWVARGLAEVVSGPVRFDRVRATPVGAAGWYLERPGFRWGAVGVAACWWGGCLPIVEALRARVHARPDDALGAARLGELYRALEAGRLALHDAAARIDGAARVGEARVDHEPRAGAAGRKQPPARIPAAAPEDAPADDLAVVAHAVRGTVADAVVLSLAAARDVLSPAALAFDDDLARRCADLELYVAQYHPGRDDASLARHLPERPLAW